jgi:hypothetical protein
LLFFYFVWRSWLAFVTPVLIWTLPTYIRLAWEYWTETPLYTRLRLGSHNQGSGGFGGMREFFKTDCTDLVNTTTPAGAPK